MTIVDNTDEERQALNEESTPVLQLEASIEALRIEFQIEFQSLRAHIDSTNNLLRPTSTGSAVNQKSETDDDLLYILPSDTITFMMVYKPLTLVWNIGVFSFLLQMLLLILIFISQINEGDGSTPFNVPFKVDNEVRIGQFAVILVCLLSQDDVLTSLQSICALWKCDCAAFQELFASGNDDPPFQVVAEARSSRDRKFYALHILLPNLLKFAQGVLVLTVTLVIIVQGQDLIDLLKDSTALFFVSGIDNIIFFCANAGYFGKKVGHQAQATTEKAILDVKKWSFKVRSIVVIIIGILMITALSFVVYGQLSGNYFVLQYPDCDVTDNVTGVTDNVTAISKMTNGICDGGELNTLGCAFDGGDCINHNLAFPGCNVKDPEKFLGNEECDGYPYNTPECKYDAGDCKLLNSYPNCDVPDPNKLNDTNCDSGAYNTILCGFDGGDCVNFDIDNCTSYYFDDYEGNIPEYYFEGNITEYYFEGNITEELGDGRCDAYNNHPVCGWDGLDCLEFNAKYPMCLMTHDNVDPERVGDGKCDNFGGYNSLECGYDGSDCSTFNLQYPDCEGENPDVIGDGNCDFQYNNETCGYDGSDCLYVDCRTDTGSYCTKYPNCNVVTPSWIGDGNCDAIEGPKHNTAECGFDGGDCVVPNYPDCRVNNPEFIGNGRCDGGAYNTPECGFDGGDCDDFNAKYPNCNVESPESIGNGYCYDVPPYNTTECGFDGGDCLDAEDDVTLSIRDLNCILSSASPIIDSLASVVDILTTSQLSDICPNGLTACEIGSTDLATQIESSCTNGTVIVESISLCQDTIESLQDAIPIIVDTFASDFVNASNFTATNVTDISKAFVTALDSLDEIQITGIPVCVASICPDDFNLFGTLGKALPILIEINLGVPADRPPMVDLLVDLLSKVIAGAECGTPTFASLTPTSASPTPKSASPTPTSASPHNMRRMVNTVTAAIVLGMAFSNL